MPSFDVLQIIGGGLGGSLIGSAATFVTQKSQQAADSWKSYQALTADLREQMESLKIEVGEMKEQIQQLESEVELWKGKFRKAARYIYHVQDWERYGRKGAIPEVPKGLLDE